MNKVSTTPTHVAMRLPNKKHIKKTLKASIINATHRAMNISKYLKEMLLTSLEFKTSTQARVKAINIAANGLGVHDTHSGHACIPQEHKATIPHWEPSSPTTLATWRSWQAGERLGMGVGPFIRTCYVARLVRCTSVTLALGRPWQ